MRRAVLVLLVVATAAALTAAPASADSAPIPAGSAAPGSDPNHSTPLELLASNIASHIAGRQVTVHCESSDDWNALATQIGFDPNAELGFVPSPLIFRFTLAFVTSAPTAYLSPAVCQPLEQFAEAATKPTKCQGPTSIQTDVTRYQIVTRYRDVVKGGKRTRIKYKVKVPYTAVVTTTGLGPPTPCFIGAPMSPGATGTGECWTSDVCYSVAANEPSAYWVSFEGYAEALMALAHEPIHLWQDQAGASAPDDSLVESQAECSAMQWLPYVAEQLGATADDAQAIANYFWTLDYPGMATLDQRDPYAAAHPYWSADCVPGGALDIRPPGSTVWP